MAVPAVLPHLIARPFSVLLLTLALGPAALRAADAFVAVFSETHNGYQRTRLPDESFQPETYAFGEGGAWTADEPGGPATQLTFARVSQAAARALARAHYVPTPGPEQTDLLILVFWGRTLGSRETNPGLAPHSTTGLSALRNPIELAPPGPAPAASAPGNREPTPNSDTQAALRSAASAAQDSLLWQVDLDNRARDAVDERNARILGYTDALERARFIRHMIAGRDLLDEIAHNRYFVVLHAYDFRTAWKEKRMKPLWSVRISIEEGEDSLDASLDRMLGSAARLFGRESRGLKRHVVPEGRAIPGPLQVIEYAPPK